MPFRECEYLLTGRVSVCRAGARSRWLLGQSRVLKEHSSKKPSADRFKNLAAHGFPLI
jgi:hypothetical protein